MIEDVELEKTFGLLHALNRDGWKRIDAMQAGLHLASLEHTSKESFLRIQFEFDAPFAEVPMLVRPEVFFHPNCVKHMCEAAVETHIEEVFAPGDVLIHMQQRITPIVRLRHALFSSASSAISRLISSKHGHLRIPAHFPCGAGDGSTAHQFRFTVRRDFPQKGKYAVAACPRQTDDQSDDPFYSSFRMLNTAALVLEASSVNPGMILLTRVMSIVGMPTWIQPWVLPKIGRVVAGRSQSVFEHLFEFRKVAHSIGTTYIIVILRKCAKGMPLLPARIDNAPAHAFSQWEQAHADVCFPGYLNEFLNRLGVQGVKFHNSLDGLSLVPYQAAVQRHEWDRAWIALEEPFRLQRAAYRFKLGGSSAPTLEVTSTPRFVKFARGYQPAPAVIAIKGGSDLPDPYAKQPCAATAEAGGAPPVRNTFVHFGSDLPLPHCGSLGRSDSDSQLAAPKALQL